MFVGLFLSVLSVWISAVNFSLCLCRVFFYGFLFVVLVMFIILTFLFGGVVVLLICVGFVVFLFLRL